MYVRVKICGITNSDDALAAADAGADAVGFVFFRSSPRYIAPDEAARIVRLLPPFVTSVGVFVNEIPGRIEEIISETGIDMVQLHGDEPPSSCSLSRRVIKGFRVRDVSSVDSLMPYQGFVSAFLLDTYSPDRFGGTGRTFPWDIAVHAKRFGNIILAGGLTPDNVDQAVETVKPFGVDVSSGVESAVGKKDVTKMRAFIARARAQRIRRILDSTYPSG